MHKSGRYTEGLVQFSSGGTGNAEKGLEIATLADFFALISFNQYRCLTLGRSRGKVRQDKQSYNRRGR
ncbi:MAG: hypothetical protein CME80_01850 [Halomonas sp.]|nr:hypothetical protein [Halomonas sp.]